MKFFERSIILLRYLLLGMFLMPLCPAYAVSAHQRHLLVTGCARSGTSYISHVLIKAGLEIRHEQLGRDGISSWTMVPDAEKTPWGPGRRNKLFRHIFHQIRDPLKTISSVFSTEPRVSWEYIMQHVPEIQPQDSKVVRAAKYWYYWNVKAAELAEWSYRVEDLEYIWDEMQQRLGRTLDSSALNAVPKNTNTRGNHMRDFSWQDLKNELDPELYQKIRRLAKFYNYIPKNE